MACGRVYLVGAGPGDPGLFTIRGREILSRADVVVYDHLACQRLLDFAPACAERIYVGKQATKHTLNQEQINQLLVDRAKAGKTVVRLKGGDPFVFGRGGEEALALVEAGIEFEVVPGVSAGIAAPAYAGIPVTHRDLASSVSLITGHESPDKTEPSLDWKTLASDGGTLAFYMGVANLDFICRQLIEHGMSSDMPAAIIQWGTTPRQRVVVGTLSDVAEKTRLAKIEPPAMIVVGKVVSLREKLNWFEKKPLFGRRIIVTRSRAQASQLTARLEELGAEVMESPAIRIEPMADLSALKQAIANRSSFDWIIFTSANGVEAYFSALCEAGLDARALAGSKIAAIGPATAEALNREGIRPDVQPERFISEEIVKALAAADNLSGKRILCPRSDIAPKDIVAALEKRGALVTDVAAYRTVADTSTVAQAAQALKDGSVDWITFTSSSTAENFFAAVDGNLVRSSRARLASIGPSTSAALRKLGFEPAVEAKNYTIPGLVEAIIASERV